VTPSPTHLSAPLDGAEHRGDFPALGQRIHGQPLVYLDNAATVQKPQCVLDELMRCYTECCANVERGTYTLGERASAAFAAARRSVQALLNARAPEEIVWVSGCTAGINLVAHAWGDVHVGAGDEIIVSGLEHHSNLVPWQQLCQRRGALLRVIPLNEHGQLRLDVYAELLGPRTRLVALAHVSNALGTLTPVREMVRLAHAVGARVLVDGAQAVSRLAVDVRELECDFYTFSGHKLYGPFGIGVLYGRGDVLEEMPAFFSGGGMVEQVEAQRSSFAEAPRRFEAGTPNLAGILGLARAIEYVRGVGLERIMHHEQDLLRYTRQRLQELTEVRLIGSAEPAAGAVSFVYADVHPHDVGTILDQHGVAVRVGHHCAQPVMQHFGVPGTVRVSFALYNVRADIDTLLLGLAHVREVFGV
jgi:cysteine desulfurase/selenocysteine lyase